MAIYTAQSTFSGNTPLSNATEGWDVVYAVKFSTINTDFAQRQPWKILNYSGQAGRFLVDTSAGASTRTLEGTISKIEIISGASPNYLRFLVTILNPVLTAPGVPTAALASINVTMDVKPEFVAGTEPGLQHLSVTDEIDPADVNVVFSPPYATGPSANARLRAIDCIVALFSSTGAGRDIISGALASVYTQDYAQSVNLPWLVPKTVAYATAALPAISPTEGVLAVLGCLDDIPADLTAVISPEAIPVNTDINAVTIINPGVLAKGTFYQALNNNLGQSGFADFVFDPTNQVVWNERDVDAYYRINAETGWSEIVTEEGVANSTGKTYGLTIPKHALRFAFRGNAIKVELLSAVVDLENGSRLVLNMSQEIELVAQADGNIDFVPVGAPVESSMIFNGPEASRSGAASFGASLLMTVIVEAVVFAVDRVWAQATHVPAKKVNLFTMDCMAAIVQGEEARSPVAVDIGGGRQLVVTKRGWTGEPIKFENKYRNSTKLRSTLPALQAEKPPVSQNRGKPNQVHPGIELTNMTHDGLLIDNLDDTIGADNFRGAQQRLVAPVEAAITPLAARRAELAQFLYNAVQAFTGDKEFSHFMDAVMGPEGAPSSGQMTGAEFRIEVRGLLSTLKSADKISRISDVEYSAGKIDTNATGMERFRFDDQNLRVIYERASKFIAARRQKGMIGDADYLRIIENSPGFIDFSPASLPVKADGSMNLMGPTNIVGDTGNFPIITARNKYPFMEPSEATIDRGMLRDLRAQMDSESPGTALKTIKLIISEQPAPKWVTFGAIGVYVVGLMIGIYFPNVLPSGESTASKTGKAAADIDGSNHTGLTDAEKAQMAATRLFGAVRFPFMTQFDTSAPRPDVVLKSAAINGGLIMGVSIVTNL